eukprot:1839525-Prorocentrum_lima.AAC.1
MIRQWVATVAWCGPVPAGRGRQQKKPVAAPDAVCTPRIRGQSTWPKGGARSDCPCQAHGRAGVK